MKRKFNIAACLFLLVSMANGQKPIPGQYIVIFNEKSVSPVIKNRIEHADRETKHKLNQAERDKVEAKITAIQNRRSLKSASILNQFSELVVGFTARLSKSEKESLENDADIEGVYQDVEFELASDETVTYIHDDITTQTVECAITKAGGFVDGSAKPTLIWILDTGIDTDHPDLNVKMAYAKSFVPNQTVEDGNGHGTHVAGIAAAKNNSIGVVGVSAGAWVVPVKILDNTGRGALSYLMAALDYVAQYDIPGDVINLSYQLGPINNCENAYPYLKNQILALQNARTYVVMAAGNSNFDAIRNSPGCIGGGSHVITVAAMTCANTWWNSSATSGSNWNSSTRDYPVDWIAVGEKVRSLDNQGGSTAIMTGTSMATPVVSGIIHARGGVPISGGTVSYNGSTYKIAHR